MDDNRPHFLHYRRGDCAQFYSPNADIAYNFEHMLRQTARGLDPDVISDIFEDYMKTTGCTFDDIGQAIKGLVLYIGTCNDPRNSTPGDALENSKFFNSNPAAQILILAKLGQILCCSYFSRSREANNPWIMQHTAESMAEEAEKHAKFFDKKLRSFHKNKKF